MKEKKIGSWIGVPLLTAAFALPGVLKGDVATNVWQGGNSTGGGWATAANWSLGVPVKGQVVKIDGGASVEMSNEDLTTAKLAAGFDVQGEGSTLYFPQNATAVNTFAPVNLGDGTRLFIQGTKDTTIKGLSGSGTVTNAFSTERILTIGVAGDTTLYEFSGRIDGIIAINSTGRLRLTGTESTTPSRLVVLRNKDTYDGAPVIGTLDIMKFGTSGDESSSIGKPPAASTGSVDIRFSGWLTYFGTGETTDRYFAFRYLTTGGRAYPNTLDAGPNGGVTFTGKFELAKEAGTAARMVLTGSNTTECVLAGSFSGDTHITKRGSGIWRFADNAERKNSGGIAVEEGTLKFDSIAEKGKVSSLGLATKLQKPYQGTYTADNDVDYAYLLGGETTNVVFEFTGSRYDAVSTRPIALKGMGARLKSSSTKKGWGLSFSRVSALAEGEAVKTLYLSGKDTGNQLGEVGDGKGKVGITKEDSGTWTLFGNQTFSGPLNVESGTLVVAEARPYTWFRFSVKGVTGQVFYMQEIGLFTSDGVRHNLGMDTVNPPTLATSSGAKGDYLSNNVDYRTLVPRETIVATSKSIYYWKDSKFHIGGMFDGTKDRMWRSAVVGTLPSWDSNWIPIVFRLAEDAPEVCACDVVTGSKGAIGEAVTAFSLEGSCDGGNWTQLLDKKTDDFANRKADSWVSNNEVFPSADGKHIPAEGWRFTGHEPAAESQLENVSAVNVAPGATLKAVGKVTLNRLTLDATRGNGTIDGFDFAEEGVLDVVSADSSEREISSTWTFLNCPEGALERLEGWRVTFDGGFGGATVSVENGAVTVKRMGTVIVVR